MTVLCGGGTSSAKPGFGRAVTVGAAAAAAYLGTKLPRPVNALVAAVIAGLSYDATDFCSRDPPADPGLTATDLAAATGALGIPAQLQANARFVQWFGSQYWYELCQCDTVQTPAVPTPSSPGPADINPQLPTGGTTIPCWQIDRSRQESAATGSIIDHTLTDLPATTRVTITSSPAPGFSTASTIPIGTTSLTFSGSSPAFPPVGHSFDIQLRFFSSSGAEVSQVSLLSNSSAGVTVPPTVTSIPGSATSWMLFAEGIGGPLVSYQFQLTFFCSGAGPDQVQTPCCPPDPSIDLRLKLIYDIVAQLQLGGGGTAPPSSYIKGTVHSGLTGEVSLPVSGLIGVQVDVTTGVPARITIGGNPTYQWDLGFLSILTADGMIEQRRLTRQHQVWLPQQGAFATVVGVFLNPGVTIDLTELKPA